MSVVLRSLAVLGSRKRLSTGLSGAVAAAGAIGSGPHTTNSVTAQPVGGVTPYVYSWVRVSGDSSIGISSASAATVSWSASGTAPSTKTATWRCTITDAAGVVVTTADVTVTVNFQVSSLSVGLSGGSVSGGGTGNGPFSTGGVTATPSGGVAPYSYSWEYVSGDGTISATASTSATTAFSASGTAPTTKTGSWRCKVADNLGTVAYSGNVSISINFTVAALSVSLDKNTASGSGVAPGGASTDSVTATPSGGVGPYTYRWERVSGDSSLSNVNLNGATTAWVRTSSTPGYWSANWRCKVTDNLGTIAYSAEVFAEVELS